MQRQRDRGLARDIEGVGEEDLLLDLAQQRPGLIFGRRHLYEGSGWFADCRREQPSVLLERAMIALLKWLLLVVRFGSSHGRDLRLKAPS